MFERIDSFMKMHIAKGDSIIYNEETNLISILVLDRTIEKPCYEVLEEKEIRYMVYRVSDFYEINSNFIHPNLLTCWIEFFKNAKVYKDDNNDYFTYYSALINYPSYQNQDHRNHSIDFEYVQKLLADFAHVDFHSSLFVLNTIMHHLECNMFPFDRRFPFYLWYWHKNANPFLTSLNEEIVKYYSTQDKNILMSKLSSYLKLNSKHSLSNSNRQLQIDFKTDCSHWAFITKVLFPLFKHFGSLVKQTHFCVEKSFDQENNSQYSLLINCKDEKIKKHLEEKTGSFLGRNFSFSVLVRRLSSDLKRRSNSYDSHLICLQEKITKRLFSEVQFQNCTTEGEYVSKIYFELVYRLLTISIVVFESKVQAKNFWIAMTSLLLNQFIHYKNDFSFEEEVVKNKWIDEYEMLFIKQRKKITDHLSSQLTNWQNEADTEDDIQSQGEKLGKELLREKQEKNKQCFLPMNSYYHIRDNEFNSHLAYSIEKIINTYCIPFYYRAYVAYLLKNIL